MRFERKDGTIRVESITKGVFVDGAMRWKDRHGDFILHEDGTYMEAMDEEGLPTIISNCFNSQKPHEKAQILKKRAAVDNEKSRDKWHQMNSKTYIP